MRALRVPERYILAECWVEDVGKEPGEGCFRGKVLELLDAKVEVVVLLQKSAPPPSTR